MLESVSIENYIKERFDSLKEVLSKEEETFTAADFHKLRVETKKLNAISRLLAFSSKKFNRIKFIKKYKELFGIAGSIRETQLELAFVEEDHLNEQMVRYIELQNRSIEKNRKLFFKKIHGIKKKISKDYSKLRQASRRVNRWVMFQYRAAIASQLSLLIYNAPHHSEGIHDLRKKLKEILYTLHMYNTGDKHTKKIDAFQDLIGKWHDKIVMAEKLSSKKWKRKLPETENETLASMKNKLCASGELMQERIIAEIKLFINGKPLLPAHMFGKGTSPIIKD